MADIKIRNASGVWVVRAFGAVIGESSKALSVEDNTNSDAIYFPRDDIAMEFLEKSDKTSDCADRGSATFYGVSTPAGVEHNAAWSYEKTPEGMSKLRDYVSFDASKITIEQL